MIHHVNFESTLTKEFNMKIEPSSYLSILNYGKQFDIIRIEYIDGKVYWKIKDNFRYINKYHKYAHEFEESYLDNEFMNSILFSWDEVIIFLLEEENKYPCDCHRLGSDQYNSNDSLVTCEKCKNLGETNDNDTPQDQEASEPAQASRLQE